VPPPLKCRPLLRHWLWLIAKGWMKFLIFRSILTEDTYLGRRAAYRGRRQSGHSLRHAVSWRAGRLSNLTSVFIGFLTKCWNVSESLWNESVAAKSSCKGFFIYGKSIYKHCQLGKDAAEGTHLLRQGVFQISWRNNSRLLKIPVNWNLSCKPRKQCTFHMSRSLPENLWLLS